MNIAGDIAGRRPARHTGRVAALGVLLLGLALLGAGTPVASAEPAGPEGAGIGREPSSKHLLMLGLERPSPYLPQVSCDPHAKPGVVAFRDLLTRFYRHGTDLGITRACDLGGLSEHKEGRALDLGLDVDDPAAAATADAILRWLIDDHAETVRRLGIMYIIWDREIWSSYRADEGWRPYDGPNPHTDHIHFSFGWAGAMQRTSWWTGVGSPTEYGPCPAGPGRPAPPYGSMRHYAPCPDPVDAGLRPGSALG